MFIQGFSKIGPPKEEEMGYIHYDHYNCTLLDLTNGCSWTFLFGVALTYINMKGGGGAADMGAPVWRPMVLNDAYSTFRQHWVPIKRKRKLKHSSEADKALKNNSAQTLTPRFTHTSTASLTYHSQGKIVEEVVVTFRWDLLMWWRRVDLHLKHKKNLGK